MTKNVVKTFVIGGQFKILLGLPYVDKGNNEMDIWVK